MTGSWMMNVVVGLFSLLALTGLFFFVLTRGALLVRGLSLAQNSAKSHVYPLYSNMRLIKLVDFQPVIAAILLFQYSTLVSKIVGRPWRAQPEEQKGAGDLLRFWQRHPTRGGGGCAGRGRTGGDCRHYWQ
jgi:hypothetical protein